MAFYPRAYTTSPGLVGLVPTVSEPMALGSPTTSPQAPEAQYLPGFLLGDNVQPPSHPTTSSVFTGSRPMQLSPNRVSPNTVSSSKPTQQSSNGFLHQADRLCKRHNTPPTQSLWSSGQKPTARFGQQVPGVPDTYTVSGIRHSTPSSATPNSRLLLPPSSPSTGAMWNQSARPLTGIRSPMGANNQNSFLTSDQLADVLQSPRNLDPDRMSEDCWVTVFGFPAARASFILSQFGQFGTIEKHIVTNDGNWMHIKYQNKLQARCALNRNGRVFGDNIMVGVIPCTDQDVMSERFKGGAQAADFDNDRENSFATGWNSPATPSRPGRQVGYLGVTSGPLRERVEIGQSGAGLRDKSWCNQSFTSPLVVSKPAGSCGVARHSSMRALAGDGRMINHLNRTTSVRQNKDSGLLSKALGYMFGWS